MVLPAYCNFPGNLSLHHIFRLAQYNYFIFFILLLPRSQMLRHFVSLEMRLTEEHNRLSGLQEEAALVQSSEDKCMSKLFTCETSIYSCKIYFLWTFYLYMAEDLKLHLQGGKKCVFMLLLQSLPFMLWNPKSLYLSWVCIICRILLEFLECLAL